MVLMGERLRDDKAWGVSIWAGKAVRWFLE